MTDEPGTIGAGKDVSSSSIARPTESATSAAIDSDAEEERSRKSRWNRRIALIGILIVLIAAAVVLPPLVNIGRYQRRITALMTRSMGRPVHMSSVELRLLPRPGFVLNDLSVSEDPGFGAEPILFARTVVASIRLPSLWRGRLEIDRVSVDEASLNLVQSADGRWNLGSLLMGAQPALTGGNTSAAAGQDKRVSGIAVHFPYLEATDSRVNLKKGLEKTPFSLVSTDLSLWQDAPGAWRVRLRGQPVRTDMEMSSADTGEVRMEASLHSAAQLRAMPLQLQMEWREAQLGQLSRLLYGSDAGWRGDVTADIAVVGTADSAQTKARLRVVGVRREEFAPGTPLDFDANCNFLYQHSQNAFHNLGCDTAIGDGRLHLKAELPGNGGKPEAMLEVSQIPLQAGLDLLRTVRSGFAPGISAKGTATGSLTYKEPDASEQRPKKPLRHEPKRPGQSIAGADASGLPADLHGTLIVDGGQLKGGELKEALVLPKITLTPAYLPNLARAVDESAENLGLSARFTIALAPATAGSLTAAPSVSTPPASAPRVSSSAVAAAPGTVASTAQPAQAITLRLGVGARGYDAAVSGSAGVAKLRELAYAFGLPHLAAAEGFTGGTAEVDFSAAGPWISSQDAATVAPAVSASAPNGAGIAIAAAPKPSVTPSAIPAAPQGLPGQDSLLGSLQMHHVQWKAAFLLRSVDLTQAMITFSAAGTAFASEFSYGSAKSSGNDLAKDGVKASASGPIRGSVTLNAPANCSGAAASDGSTPLGSAAPACEPQVELRFAAVDTGALQAALLGAPEEKSLFSPLMDRMRSSERPKLPEVEVNAQAESLVLGSATLQSPVVHMQFKPTEVVLKSWQADLLGGSAKGTGHFAWNGAKPEYTFEGGFTRVNAAALGSLLNATWAGGPVSGNGSLKLSGLSAKELTASASGELSFDWVHGALSIAPSPSAEARPQETKFDDWKGKVSIQDGKAQIGQNELIVGKHSSNMAGVIPFGGPIKLTVAPSGDKLTAHAAVPASPPTVK
jgi:AsmA family/AsmA-like C-terminal region